MKDASPHWKTSRLTAGTAAVASEIQTHCVSSRNNVGSVPTLFLGQNTLLGAFQQCCSAHNNVFGASNNVWSFPTMLGRSQHCFYLPNIVGANQCVGERLTQGVLAGGRRDDPNPCTTRSAVHFPVRSRHRPKVMAGGTSPPGRQPGAIIPSPRRGDSGTLVPCAGGNGERRESASPRHRSTPFASFSPRRRRPAVPRLRTIARTGWERLYVLR